MQNANNFSGNGSYGIVPGFSGVASGGSNWSGSRGNFQGGRGNLQGGRGGGGYSRPNSQKPQWPCINFPPEQPRQCPGCGASAVVRVKTDNSGAYWSCPARDQGGKWTPCLEGCGWLGKAVLVHAPPAFVQAQGQQEEYMQYQARVYEAQQAAAQSVAQPNAAVAPVPVVVKDDVQVAPMSPRASSCTNCESRVADLAKHMTELTKAMTLYFASKTAASKKRKLEPEDEINNENE